MLKLKSLVAVALIISLVLVPFSTVLADGNGTPSATAIPVAPLVGPRANSIVDTNYYNGGNGLMLPNGLISPMGTSKPTQYWNLGSNYNGGVSAFLASTYTNYYFTPNASGQLNVSFSDVYPSPKPATERALNIDCWDKSANKIVASYQTEGVPDLYNNVSFYNLDPNKFYFLHFNKTLDGIAVDFDFTVYWP